MGGAIKDGLKSASKEVIIYTDCDYPAKENDIKRALAMLKDVDIITSHSLVIKDRKINRIIMSKTYNILI